MRVTILVCVGMVVLLGFAFFRELKSEENFTDIRDEANDRPSHHHIGTPKYQGFWKKKFVFRPRWVKTWQEKKIYVAVWKRIWGPVEVKEWVPVPKPPPGWVKPNPGAYFVRFPH